MTTTDIPHRHAHQQRTIAASRLGITLEEYNAHLDAGEKWCSNCHAWHPRSAFGRAARRADGLQGECREAKRTPAAQHRDLHQGHDVTVRSNGWPYCRTCRRGGHDIDEMAVVRAVSGDPPARLSVAEQAEAVVELRRHGLTYKLIAERVGCTLWVAWSVCDEHGLTKPRKDRRGAA